MQKTYTTDYLSKKVKKNNGEVRQYLVEHSHEPIIDPETFDHVQEMLAKNHKRRTRVYSDYTFSGRIICGDCGTLYGRDIWRVRSTGERYPIWYCNHKYDGESICQTKSLREEEVKDLFEEMQVKRKEANVSYSDERWRELVQSLTVYQDGRFVFSLTNGEVIELVH